MSNKNYYFSQPEINLMFKYKI